MYVVNILLIVLHLIINFTYSPTVRNGMLVASCHFLPNFDVRITDYNGRWCFVCSKRVKDTFLVYL